MDRKQLKREKARYPLMQRRIAEADARLAELERERDGAEQMYQRDVQPLQLELADIEEKSIEDIQERRPLDQSREQRRKNLASEIETAAVILASKIGDINKRVELVKAEREKLAASLPVLAAINADLFRTGDEARQLRHYGLTEAIKGIGNSFLFGFSRNIADVRDALKSSDPDKAEHYRHQLRRMESVLVAVSGVTQQMQAEADQLYRELIEQ